MKKQDLIIAIGLVESGALNTCTLPLLYFKDGEKSVLPMGISEEVTRQAAMDLCIKIIDTLFNSVEKDNIQEA